MSELLNPHRKDISQIYESEFVRMSQVEVSLQELERVREVLIQQINETMTDNEKKFLLSFKQRKPDWKLLEIEQVEEVAALPSVRWKLQNLNQMPKDKHDAAVAKLKTILNL